MNDTFWSRSCCVTDSNAFLITIYEYMAACKPRQEMCVLVDMRSWSRHLLGWSWSRHLLGWSRSHTKCGSGPSYSNGVDAN